MRSFSQEKRILDLHARVEALEAKQRQKPGATAELVERVATASTPEDAIREVADWLEQQQHILAASWTNACIYFAELLRNEIKVPQKEACRPEPEKRYLALSTTASGHSAMSTTCRASSINDAFRKALDKIYGKSCWWRPEGPHDPEPDIHGYVWFRGYVTRWREKANAYSIESPLLLIKIKPLA